MTRDARPREREADERTRTRTINWTALGHAVTPRALRHRAINVDVSTDKRRYEPGEPVDITVTFHNRLPTPIRIRTDSPNYWYWTVDGHREASQVPRAVPDRPDAFSFARRERKRFRRQWHQRIQVSDDEWRSVDPGQHTIAVGLTRSDTAARGLVDTAVLEIIS